MIGFYEDIDYNNVDPWKFLDNLGANAVTLGASYKISGNAVMASKCDAILERVIELERLIREANM